MTSSAAIRLERRPRPRAPSPIEPPAQQPRPVQRPQQPQPVQPKVRQQPPPRRELARINPRAEISVPRISSHGVQASSFSRQLASQEHMYTETIARLRRQSDPVIGAARPTNIASSRKRYVYDFAGSIGTPFAAEGILIPRTAWTVGPWDYYYVRYWVLYPDGSNETGEVPWPVRFPAQDDPIKLHMQHMPLPGPLPDYVLPADADLHPLVAYCYEHKFPSCPIAHD